MRGADVMPRITTRDGFWMQTGEAADGCILWLGRKDAKGYGRIGWNSKQNRRAHRVAWEMERGPIPDGLCVLHRCDTPACVNLEHLFLGTQRENIADRDAKGRTVDPPSRRKLSDEQVVAMRRAHAAGLTQEALAARFGVSRGNVSKILNRRSYTHVP